MSPPSPPRAVAIPGRGPAADEPPAGEVAAMIQHEIRTTFTVIRGYLRLLIGEEQGALSPDQRGFALEARRATERVLGLLDNLLHLEADAQALPVVRKHVRLGDVLGAALATARPLLEEAGIKPELRVEAHEQALLADPDRLEQVFVNLIRNATAHAPRGSRLEVEAGVAEMGGTEVVSIAFADEGPGVSDEEVERIFRPFVQGHGAAGVASGGLGLGLAICRRIVEQHGGSIDAVPSLGHGLFRVTLPLHRDPARETDR